LFWALAAGCARSDKPYPNQAITIVCPWSAGGGSDRLSRFMADQLQAKLGQPVVVANKTGGSGAIGFAAGANAAPDGYTITMATFEISTMHWLGISKLTYQNFTPLVQLNGDAAALLVRSDSAIKTLEDLLAAIRSQPGKLKMSGTAKGAAWDLARSGFLMAAGLPVDSVVWAPVKGAAQGIVELLGGHIDVVCCSVPEALTQIESGELRALAVMAPQRLNEFPNIPTCRELGVDWEAVGYRGLALPRDAPPNVVKILGEACLEIARSDAFAAFMKKNGFAPEVRGPAEFGEFLRQQDEQWHKVILGSTVGATSLHGNAAVKSSDPGPWAVPGAAGAFVLAVGLMRALRSRQGSAPPSAGPDGTARPMAVALVALIIYALVMPRLGFFATTLVFAALATRFLGQSWLSSALSAAILLGSIYLLFVRLFKVPLPAGFLF
jgi:tripartite-type tricarboxylate transporter receptor subunit TctC